MPKPYPEEFRRTLLDLVAAGRRVAQEFCVIYHCAIATKPPPVPRLERDPYRLPRARTVTPGEERSRPPRPPPTNAIFGQRVIEPNGIATRTLSIQKVGIVQPANRAEATTASYYQGGFAAHVPGCGGAATRLDRGSGEGNMESVMPIDDFKDLSSRR